MNFPILFAILITICCMSNFVPINGQCLEDQRNLLLHLKNTLKFNSSLSTKLVKWNPDTDCCLWEGVACSEAGHVTALDLSFESISGGITNSSTLFSLNFLQTLNLAYNNFNFTPIPPEFNNLTSLTNLNLSNSNFVGQIPTELSQLTRLVTLDLSSLYVSELFLENPNLTMFVQNLTELTELYLDTVKISAHGYDWGKAISSGLPNLRVLSLSDCDLSGPIDSSLANLQFLSVIHLDGNYNLSSPVPEFIADFKNLTSLSLRYCNLNGVFPHRIFGVQTLRNLDLSYNELLHGSLPEFHPNGSMQELLLRLTNFSGSLPNSIGNLHMLSMMDLSTGNFSGEIPSSIANLTLLSILILSANTFSGSIPSFQMLNNLTLIDLSGNNLSGQLSPTQFEGLVNLKDIYLVSNSFSGRIPFALFSLPSLQNCQLQYNHFTGTLGEIPNASSSLLEWLDLSSNKLEGEIPSSFFDLKMLNYLSMSFNNLNGTLKLENVRKLINLTGLSLSHNNLSIETSGENSSNLYSFPQLTELYLASCKLRYFPDLKNQTRLFDLDLSDNQIFGEIPNWIWTVGGGGLNYLNLSRNRLEKIEEPYNISSLLFLDLHSNHLKGKLPITPPAAEYLDYSSNNFTSSIPFDIGNNLTIARFFSVAHNNLNGTIPNSICNATSLEVLDMSDNNLSGTIPSCLIEGNETPIILNLGKNRLTGNIFGTFRKNCSLRTLDLNGNRFEGKIPESLANCASLEVLNLGNNRINDVFPCFLNNFTNFRVLVLRSNMFYGGIGCPGVKKNWEKLQIIDLASNNFSGPLIPIRFLKLKAMIDEPKLNQLNFMIRSGLYYQDTVTVTNKGLEMVLVKILTIFTAIDFSMNRFEGEIPAEIGELKSLHVLNLSHNSLSNSVPSSLGNLKQLESLDLSGNDLSGMIPVQLASLTFLAFLNLSDNQLTGRIPTGTQFQSFNESSFEGNKGLCGPPLNINCINSETNPTFKNKQTDSKGDQTKWEFLSGAGVGYSVGLGFVIVPLFFCKRWSELYWKCVHRVTSYIVNDK